MGGTFAQAPVDDRGLFGAIDLLTNTIAWRREWREMCYSGSINTAGGILFVGRNDGRLTALDNRNGDQLWEFKTDAGVNTTATTFEYKGKQLVVVHPGGAAFAGSQRGDTIWMFSLDGKIEQVVEAVTPPPGPRAVVAATVALVASVDNGSTIYDNACVACHGETGQGGGSVLNGTALSLSQIMLIVNAGRNTMPAFAGLTQQELLDISTFVVDAL
jgi:mono/diheme cytochrome c family protein